MKYAVLADIHSNLEALNTAADYLASAKINHYLILGDMVGYAANPNECLEVVSKMPAKIVIGNHDAAAMDLRQGEGFTKTAYEAIVWTKNSLEARWNDFLSRLPYVHITTTYTMTHASVDSPEVFQYLFYLDDAMPSFRRMETPLGWIGHTHVPQIFMAKGKSTAYLNEGMYPLDRNETYLINPGSVGQPRDRDSRLSLAVFDEEAYRLQIVRLPYDCHKTAKKIREAGLPESLAARLL